MIVIRVGCLCIRLAYVYESYTYDSPTGMNHTCKLIVRVDFSRARQSYAYETGSHIFYPSFRCGFKLNFIRQCSGLENIMYDTEQVQYSDPETRSTGTRVFLVKQKSLKRQSLRFFKHCACFF